MLLYGQWFRRSRCLQPPRKSINQSKMAERVGFEPTVRFPVRSLSRRVLSTAQSPLRGHSFHFIREGDVGAMLHSTRFVEAFLKLRLQSYRRSAKNDCRRELASSASTPGRTSTW